MLNFQRVSIILLIYFRYESRGLLKGVKEARSAIKKSYVPIIEVTHIALNDINGTGII